ncbi:unnamed protein product [Phytomonas sp. EM1]|nr:unnamed protein product [Phytomonas sp. EM1]|eukprot:CCW63158.1 unnamed protein product [Phytomonas sp. isolate EM1]
MRRVAEHVRPASAAALARKARQTLRTVKAVRWERLWSRWEGGRQAQQGGGAGIAAVELAAGVGSRLGRRLSCRGVIRYPSDVQVSEVLPNGRVVCLTRPTQPDRVGAFTKSLRSVLKERKTCRAEGGGTVAFLHFVLYRECLPFVDAVRILTEVTATATASKSPFWDRFEVNVNLEDSMVCVQTCSARLVLPEGTVTEEDELLTRAESELSRLLHVNLRPLPLSVQVLGWRRFGCSQALAPHCRVQYAMLIRSVTRRMNHLEPLVRACAAAIPNFFAPRHFGPLDCPFRTYDVAAAFEKGEFAEAMMMAVCLAQWSARKRTVSKEDNAWISRAVSLLEGGEERQGLWREWVLEVLPPALLELFCQAKADLLWNVLASCRIQQHRGGGRDAMIGASPEQGDFVVVADSTRGGERTPLHCCRSPKQEATLMGVLQSSHRRPLHATRNGNSDEASVGRGVIQLTSAAQAAAFTLHDLLIPLFNTKDCAALNRLAKRLGFRHAGDPLPTALTTTPVTTAPVAFRALFAQTTGRASGAWVREFDEPLSGSEVDSPSSAEYRLSSDLDLVAGGTDFTAKSRGRSGLARCRPIDRRGRTMADRLPAGLLASTALREAAATTPSALSKCLIMHLTLPAETYCSNLLREFIMILNRVDQEAADAVEEAVGKSEKINQAAEAPAPTERDVDSPEDNLHGDEQWLEGNLLSLKVRGMDAQKASRMGLISDNLTDGPYRPS